KGQLDENIQLYKVSNLTKPVEGEYDIESVRLVSVFQETRVGKVRVNQKDNFWVYLDSINNLMQDFKEKEQKSAEELKLDDIFYSINSERKKSKEIVKTVLSAKDFLNNKKNKNISTNQLKDSSMENNKLNRIYASMIKKK